MVTNRTPRKAPYGGPVRGSKQIGYGQPHAVQDLHLVLLTTIQILAPKTPAEDLNVYNTGKNRPYPPKKAREVFWNTYAQLRKLPTLAPKTSTGATYACHHKTGYGHPYAGQHKLIRNLIGLESAELRPPKLSRL